MGAYADEIQSAGDSLKNQCESADKDGQNNHQVGIRRIGS